MDKRILGNRYTSGGKWIMRKKVTMPRNKKFNCCTQYIQLTNGECISVRTPDVPVTRQDNDYVIGVYIIPRESGLYIKKVYDDEI